MASYDSDSSSDDGAGYTTTNVVLGYVSDEATGEDISHVGGHPVWLDPKLTPPVSRVKCKVCSDNMSLLLQLNADLQQHFPSDTRRLQVWICRKKACTRKPGSIRTFREVKKAQTGRSSKVKPAVAAMQESDTGLGNVLFGGNSPSQAKVANPFSTNSASSTAGTRNPFSSVSSNSVPASQSVAADKLPQTFAEKLQIGTAQSSAPVSSVSDPWPGIDKFPPPYSFFYLDAGPEDLDPTPTPPTEPTAESSRTRYDVDDVASSTADKDAFESSLDKTFQKFSDIVAQNPEQVLRYEFKGQPLLYSGSDGVATCFVVPHGKAGAVRGIPRCEKCGSQRVYEMQLMPYLIYEIERDETVDIDSGMEWGTIIVGTCVSNCGEAGTISFCEEWTGVQWEERIARR